MSKLLKAMTKGTGNGWTENGAISYDTTMSNALDYFSKVGTYQKRDQAAVDLDMLKIFSEDQEVALRLVFASRLITRKPNVDGLEDVQTGFGRKDEFYKAIVWMNENKPELLKKNLHLIPVFGSWKDFLTEPLITKLDRKAVLELFAENLSDPLVLKYLPQMRSINKVRSERDRLRSQFASDLAKHLGLSHKDYRKLKSVGPAHIFQRQMSANQWGKINFSGIPGRAMTKLMSLKGKDGQSAFERHNQVERLKNWVLKQKDVKFNGYPYELTQAASVHKKPGLVQKFVYDKQFENLLSKFGNHNLGNVLCALDTSGSMTIQVVNNLSALDICLSLGLVFSSLNVGHFKNHAVAFDYESRLIKLNGTFTERLHQIEKMTTAWGSTNFQSVIDLLVRTRQQSPEIPVEEYPETLLVVSDMQFNPTDDNAQTNHEAAMQKLKSVGLGEMRVIWWNVTGRCSDFPAQMDSKNTYIIGGFDPVMLKALFGLNDSQDKAETVTASEKVKDQTPLDGMMNVLNQPIFSLLNF